MIHIQVSIKFDEDTYQELGQVTGWMRMNKHAFVVNSVKEILKLIRERGKERMPLLVAQARTAQDHVQDAALLHNHSEARAPERRRGKA